MPHQTLPLSGVRVLDVATMLAAPLAVSLLGELGADVIKVELPVGGDPARGLAPYADGAGLHWRVTGRNRRSVTLDLHDPDGVRLLHELAKECDVVVTNLRRHRLQEWGVDFDDLRASHPTVVMLHLSAFGRTGPYAGRPGFARIAEAFSGLTEVTGFADGPPVFAGYPLADGVAGVYGAFTILAALRQRDLTGEAQLIDLALYEPMLRIMEDFVVGYSGNGTVKRRMGNDQPNIAPNNLYPTRDGRTVVLPASTDRMWTRLTALIGDPQLEQYPTNEVRMRHRQEIDERIARFTRQYDLDEMMAVLEENGIACGKVYTVADIFEDPQIEHRQNLLGIDDPDLGPLTVQAPVPTYSGFVPEVTAAPQLGEHNDEVYLGLLGLGEDAYQALRDRKVI